jgi:uncharacterized membrane protein YtjA (UPF0391 family)
MMERDFGMRGAKSISIKVGWSSRVSGFGRHLFPTNESKGTAMLSWAITFLLIALLAGLFGFGLVGGMAYSAAKICFFVFLVLAVISLLSGRRIDA